MDCASRALVFFLLAPASGACLPNFTALLDADFYAVDTDSFNDIAESRWPSWIESGETKDVGAR